MSKLEGKIGADGFFVPTVHDRDNRGQHLAAISGARGVTRPRLEAARWQLRQLRADPDVIPTSIVSENAASVIATRVAETIRETMDKVAGFGVGIEAECEIETINRASGEAIRARLRFLATPRR